MTRAPAALPSCGRGAEPRARLPLASQFANPRNMTPYEYHDSPLTLPDAEAWDAGRPGRGAPTHAD